MRILDNYLRNDSYCGAFCGSRICEITLPSTLRTIKDATFKDCKNLNIVWVEDGCTSDVRYHVQNPVVVLKKNTKVKDQLLWMLREQKNVELPEGIKEIGDRWFMGSQIENITIPASVREIGNEAFRKCLTLRRAVFAKGSHLEAVGDLCFADSGIQEINAPRSLRAIGKDVFARCKSIRLGRWYV